MHICVYGSLGVVLLQTNLCVYSIWRTNLMYLQHTHGWTTSNIIHYKINHLRGIKHNMINFNGLDNKTAFCISYITTIEIWSFWSIFWWRLCIIISEEVVRLSISTSTKTLRPAAVGAAVLAAGAAAVAEAAAVAAGAPLQVWDFCPPLSQRDGLSLEEQAT